VDRAMVYVMRIAVTGRPDTWSTTVQFFIACQGAAMTTIGMGR